MATDPAIDRDLLQRALAASGERTKKAAVTRGAAEVHRPPRAGAHPRSLRHGRDRSGVRLQG